MDLAQSATIAKSTLSSHLNVLKAAGLIVFERHGTSLVYGVNESAFEAALAGVIEIFSRDGRRKGGSR